jgi:hypothetical protein
MLIRKLVALYSYEKARKKEEKHAAALDEAVRGVHTYLPRASISATELRRTVAQLRPRGCPFAYTVQKIGGDDPELPQSVCQLFKVPEGSKMKQRSRFGIVPRTDYRINAKSPRFSSSQV